jgi:flagellar assembly protein FliH
MTVIKRSPNEPMPAASSEAEGVRASEGVRRRVLRDYATHPEVRIAGILSKHAASDPLALVPLHEEGPIDIAAAQEQIYHFQQDAKQKLQVELADTRARAQADLQRELADMRAQFDRDLERHKAKTIEEAYTKGFAKGQEDGQSQYASAVRDVFAAVTRVGQEKQAFLANSQQEILALSLRAAQKMVLAEISQTPEALLNIVMDAIRRITDKDKVIIKFNSKDVDHMRQYQERILAQMPDIKSLEIHEDTRVDEGGCVIETRLGYIDATLATKVAILEKAFVKAAED